MARFIPLVFVAVATVACKGGGKAGGAVDVLPAEDEPFDQLAAGGATACAQEVDGDLVCWGWDGYAQATARFGPYTDLDVGLRHACGVDSESERVACWGDILAIGTIPDVAAKRVGLGRDHGCLVSANDELFCWGQDAHGQASPPSGSFADVDAGAYHTCALATDGAIACFGSAAGGRLDAPSGTFSAVSVGDRFACAVGSAGAACWGDGAPEAPSGTFEGVTVGEAHACFWGGGSVTCVGEDDAGQLGVPAQGVAAAAGARFTCVLTADGDVVCAGDASLDQAALPLRPSGTGFSRVQPPERVDAGATAGNGIVLFLEAREVSAPGTVTSPVSRPGVYVRGGAASPGAVGSAPLDVYYVHLDAADGTQQATIRFPREIRGVFLDDDSLDLSDPLFGRDDVSYGTGVSGRGALDGDSRIELKDDLRTLVIGLDGSGGDALRVATLSGASVDPVGTMGIREQGGLRAVCECRPPPLDNYVDVVACERSSARNQVAPCDGVARVSLGATGAAHLDCRIEAAEGLQRCMSDVTCPGDPEAASACLAAWEAEFSACPDVAAFEAVREACIVGESSGDHVVAALPSGNRGVEVRTLGGGDDFSAGPDCDERGAGSADAVLTFTAPSAGTWVFDTRESAYEAIVYVLDDTTDTVLACGGEAALYPGAPSTADDLAWVRLGMGETVRVVVDGLSPATAGLAKVRATLGTWRHAYVASDAAGLRVDTVVVPDLSDPPVVPSLHVFATDARTAPDGTEVAAATGVPSAFSGWPGDLSTCDDTGLVDVPDAGGLRLTLASGVATGTTVDVLAYGACEDEGTAVPGTAWTLYLAPSVQGGWAEVGDGVGAARITVDLP